jgi:DNA repair photolyase
MTQPSKRVVRMVAAPAASVSSPPQAIKGRGAVSSPQGRFDTQIREATNDGWDTVSEFTNEFNAESESRPPTRVKSQPVKKVISVNQSPDISFDQSVNPYRGCEHGCVYCYARPGHAYDGLSPGLDFETRIFARDNAAQRLAEELDKPNYVCEPITIGSFTDAYQPIERSRELTRSIIKVLVDRRHPFAIITKGALIQRDTDLLAQAARHDLVACFVSITTSNPELSRIWEPRASAPHRRFETIRVLTDAGIPTGVNVAPIAPFINDREIETILEQAADAGAHWGRYIMLRLPNEVRPIFIDWLNAHFPERASRVLNKLKELREPRGDATKSAGTRGDTQRINDPNFHTRMTGQGPWADLIANRFRIACRRHGLKTARLELRKDLFEPLPNPDQMKLF